MTIREHLETIEDQDIRGKALNNLDYYMADEEVPDLLDALYLGFFFELTPEGADYWNDYIKTLLI